MVESPTPTMVACVVVLGETPNTSSQRPASPETNARGTPSFAAIFHAEETQRLVGH